MHERFGRRVKNGRLVLDTPTTPREGTVIYLIADDEGDDLTDHERRVLHETLQAFAREKRTPALPRMSGYGFHRKAFTDIHQLLEYIAEHNIDAADRREEVGAEAVVVRLESGFADISDHVRVV